MSPKKRSRKTSKNRRYGLQDRGHVVRSGKDAGQKMSQVLLDFIKPYQQFTDTDKATDRLVAIGVTAWNVSLLPEHERDAMLTKLATDVLSGGSLIRRIVSMIKTAIFGQSREVAEFKQVVNELVKRKLAHYGRNRRFIVNYELSQTEDDIHLFVVSTLTPIP